MKSNSGFTLLELLVSLALLAVIGVGLTGALQIGSRAYTASNEISEAAPEVASRALLRRLLSRAVSPSLLTPFPSPFEGSTNRLVFVTLEPLQFAAESAATRVTVSAEDAALLMRLESIDDTGEVLATYDRRLTKSFSVVKMSYFGDAEDGLAWGDTWDDMPTLPKLVSIEIAGAADPYWPDFTVELIYSDDL